MDLSWIESAINALAAQMPSSTFLSQPAQLRGLLAVLPVCLVCGLVGSLVVGNRMAFFSDALAHCAFAGVALGLLAGLVTGAPTGGGLYQWGIPLIMVAFGVAVGLGIVLVREKTALSSDTVIGVFFAGAIGFGAMLMQGMKYYSPYTPDVFLFGNPVWVQSADYVLLFLLSLVTVVLLSWLYNRLIFASFNASLARSRRIPLRLFNYVFIVLLALIVNLSLKSVGALLINAMLIVPAATASNLSRNLRQMFWLSLGLSLAEGFLGAWVASVVSLPGPARGSAITFGWGGTIVVISTILFFVSMVVRPWVLGARAAD